LYKYAIIRIINITPFLPDWVLMADALFANALLQFGSNQLPLRPYRRHWTYESLHVVGEIVLAFFGRSIGD